MQENFEPGAVAENRSFNVIPPPSEEQDKRKEGIEGLICSLALTAKIKSFKIFCR